MCLVAQKGRALPNSKGFVADLMTALPNRPTPTALRRRDPGLGRDRVFTLLYCSGRGKQAPQPSCSAGDPACFLPHFPLRLPSL